MRNRVPMVCAKCHKSIIQKTSNGLRLCDFHKKEHGKNIRSKYKDKIKKTLKKWRDKNRIKIKEHNKRLVDSGYFNKWRINHKQSVINTRKKILIKFKENIYAKNTRRSIRLKQLAGFHTEEQWINLKRSYRNKCFLCKKTKKLTKDHIIPIWEKNSTNYISNIRPLCGQCNSREGGKYSKIRKVAL